MLEELKLETIEGEPHKYKVWKWRDGEAEKTGVKITECGVALHRIRLIENRGRIEECLMAESNNRRLVFVPISWLFRYAETPISEPEVRH